MTSIRLRLKMRISSTWSSVKTPSLRNTKLKSSLNDRSALKRTKKDKSAFLASKKSWRRKRKAARSPCRLSVT